MTFSKLCTNRGVLYRYIICHRASLEFIESQPLRTDGVHCRESAGTRPVVHKAVPMSERVLPFQVSP